MNRHDADSSIDHHTAATTEFEKLLASCREIVRKVEVDGLHVAATGNAYGVARELLDSLKEAA